MIWTCSNTSTAFLQHRQLERWRPKYIFIGLRSWNEVNKFVEQRKVTAKNVGGLGIYDAIWGNLLFEGGFHPGDSVSVYMTDLGELLDRLGLSQYLERLVDEGFEKWEAVMDITEQDL